MMMEIDAQSWLRAFEVRQQWKKAQASLRVRNATTGETRMRAEQSFLTTMSLMHIAFVGSNWRTESFSRLSGLSLHQLNRLQRIACEIA